MKIGKGTRVWKPELSNLSESAVCGENCVIHSHVWIGDRVTMGDNCKIQGFCYLPPGVRLGNDVFLGPRVTFTNDKHPPSNEILQTFVGDWVSVGAGAVILPGITLGKGCTIGAGAVVTKDVPNFAIVVGNPARIVGSRMPPI